MITVDKIRLLLPDNVLVALTDDQKTGEINEALVAEIINDGYRFVRALTPNLEEGLLDECVKNYVLASLYKLAGLDEKAQAFQDLYAAMLKNFASTKKENEAIAVASYEQQFTAEELSRW